MAIKKLSVTSLVLINVIAIDSIRSIGINATYGANIILYYLAAGLLFFIPTALVAAELSSTWNEEGGLYLWIKKALGKKIGFLAIFLQWIYNIFWYPTILSLLAATLAYIINPKLADNKPYTLSVILITYWLTTWINSRGMKYSSLLSNISAIIGTIIPMISIILLGIIWQFSNNNNHLSFDFESINYIFSHRDNLIMLSSILFSLVGIEMSAYHVTDVENPAKNYPKALLLSTILILVTGAGSALAVANVVPSSILRKSLVDGILEAFSSFFIVFKLQFFMPIIAIFIILGIIGGVGAWIIGPSKGLLTASKDIKLPTFMSKINKHNTPVGILFIQAIIVTIISLPYIYMPSVNSAFFMLSNITAQLALVGYILMFISAFVLRFTQPNLKRNYKIPGGNIVMGIICSSGIIVSVLTIILTFLPPQDINVGNVTNYLITLIISFLFFIIIPLCFKKI